MNSEQPASRARGGMLASAVLLCVLAFASRSPVARAEGDSPHEASEYRELIEQALSEFKHKNWPEARVLFRRAHELSPNARTLRGMGVVSYEMRDYVHAVLELSSALSDARQPLTDAQRKECEALLGRSRTFVAAFVLKLEPSSADVTLDGAAPVRDKEGRMLVSFGEHTLRAVAEGFQDASSKLAVQGGEQGELRVVLYRPQAAASATPASNVEKTVRGATPSPASAPLTSGPPRSHGFVGHGLRYSWVALGAGAVLGAAAAASWFVGQGKVDELDSSCARLASTGMTCQRGDVDTAAIKRYERATTTLLGLTGAAVVAAGVLFSLEWPTERRREQKLALDLAPQRISVRGTF